jgi:phospholipid-transporting ATPase
LASRNIPDDEYRRWSAKYEQAASQIHGRAEALEKIAEEIEQNLHLLGATAIEDKLQDGVPDTIHTLQQAGIKVSPGRIDFVAVMTYACVPRRSGS